MTHIAIKHIGDRFNTAMWMPWKSCCIVCGFLTTEIIKKEKWIKAWNFDISKSAAKSHPCPLGHSLGFKYFADTLCFCHAPYCSKIISISKACYP